MTAQARTLLGETEAAAMLSVSPRTLRAIRSAGKIRYVRAMLTATESGQGAVAEGKGDAAKKSA